MTHLDRVSLSRLLVQNGTPLESDLREGRLADSPIEALESRPWRRSRLTLTGPSGAAPAARRWRGS
ncbi:MAG: hypothetical protein R3F17_12090 [Planctomycetota bacterium]